VSSTTSTVSRRSASAAGVDTHGLQHIHVAFEIEVGHQYPQLRRERLVSRIFKLELTQFRFDAAHMADAPEPVQILEMMARAAARAARGEVGHGRIRGRLGFVDPIELQ
jgi:hypothetical protein